MKKGILVLFGILNLITGIWAQDEKRDSVALPDSQPVIKPILEISSQKPLITNGYDRIVKLNRDTLVVTIHKITQTEIVYNYPFNNVINRIPVFHVKEIFSKDGTPNLLFKSLSGPLKKAKNDSIPLYDWKAIVVTYDKAEVEGMVELGTLNSRSEGERATTSAALIEKNAISQLRKKAAQLGATKVLVTDKNEQSAYGENPVVELKGTAYK